MKKLLTAGIILALVGSNVIIGKSYINDSKEYENRIRNQNKLIKQYKINKQENISLIRNKSLEILILREQVSKQQKQIEQQQKELSNHSPPKSYFEVTAYTENYESTQKHKGENGYGITASGTKVKEGVTIACPQSFDFGTKLNIEGVGLRVCQDRGHAITSNKIDLYVASLTEALQFGRKKLLVEVID
jgi:3D (Asp-Asp-Asp) domain-containing protein